MTEPKTITSPEHQAVNGLRVLLGIGGVVALVLGILIIVAPLKTASVVTAIIAVYAIVQGLIYGGIAIFSRPMKTWSRIGYLVLGLVFIALGVTAFFYLGEVTTVLALVVTIFIGAAWVVEGVVAFVAIGDAPSKGWAIFYGILALVAGVFMIFLPFWGIAILWIFLGISLGVLGIVQIVRAFLIRPDRIA